jgi:hypothetical protein
MIDRRTFLSALAGLAAFSGFRVSAEESGSVSAVAGQSNTNLGGRIKYNKTWVERVFVERIDYAPVYDKDSTEMVGIRTTVGVRINVPPEILSMTTRLLCQPCWHFKLVAGQFTVFDFEPDNPEQVCWSLNTENSATLSAVFSLLSKPDALLSP